MLIIFITYFVTAKLGLSLFAVSGFASLVWAPAGIALTSMLIIGVKIWPVIFLAAFLINLDTGAPLFTALAIGTGNSLGAVVGTLLLKKAEFSVNLERVKYAVFFIVLGSGLSTLVSSFVGTGSLFLSSLIETPAIFDTWLAWWIGDMLGVLIVGFLILSSRNFFINKNKERKYFLSRPFEALTIFVGLIVFNYFIFLNQFNDSFLTGHKDVLIYLLFPILILLALRLHSLGAALGIFITSIIAIYATVIGLGPFSVGETSRGLLLLQIFMGSVSITIMVLATAIVKRINSYQILEKLDRAKSEFLSIASHQLRSPLTIIKWYTNSLLEGRLDNFEPKQVEYLKIIETSNQKMIDLVNTLLNASKIEHGTFQIVPISSVVVRTILNDVIKEYSHQIKQKKLKVESHYTENVFKVSADPALIQIVFQNLLSNSIKYSPEKKTIVVKLKNTARDWTIEVSDQGHGIPESEQSQIFTKLFRAQNARKIDPDGNGLGLYVVKSLTERVGGIIWFESELDKGSTFHVSFPINKMK